MATAPSARPLPHMNLGFIGHTNHGKSLLCRALMRRLGERPDGYAKFPKVMYGPLPTPGVILPPPDLWSRETRCYYAETPERAWSLFDLPGRRQYLRVAMSAMGCLDAAVLVVSAVDGDGAQTREHLLHARGLGAGQLVVYLSHCDQVDDPAWLDEVEREMRRMLVDSGREGDEVPIVRGGLWDAPLDRLIEVLDHDLALPTRQPDGPPVALIREVHSIRGRGTVAVATQLRGTFQVNQELSVRGANPARFPSRVAVCTSLEQHGARVHSVSAGDTFGALLRLLTRQEVRRGEVLTLSSNDTRFARRFACTMELLPPRRGVPRWSGEGARGQFCVGTAKVPGTLVSEGEGVGARREKVIVALDWPVWMEPGLGLSFRDGCQWMPARDGVPVWGGSAGEGKVTAVLESAEAPGGSATVTAPRTERR